MTKNRSTAVKALMRYMIDCVAVSIKYRKYVGIYDEDYLLNLLFWELLVSILKRVLNDAPKI